MAGGKETPRQKMIGMMYLVLTALLALNVSKSILDAFVAIEENIQKSNIAHLDRGEGFKKDVNSELNTTPNNAENAAKRAKLQKILKQMADVDVITEKLIQDIDKIKFTILEKSGENVKDIKDNDELTIIWKKGEKYTPARMNLMAVQAKDQYDIPMHEIIGEDIKNPTAAGKKLWADFNQYRADLVKVVGTYNVESKKYTIAPKAINTFKSNSDLAAQVDKMIASSKANLKEDAQVLKDIYINLTKSERSKVNDMEGVHWIGATFDHSPLVAAVASLSSMQQDILSARAMAMAHLKSKVTTGEYSFNKIVGLAYGQSFANTGDEVDVNVMMAAFDSDNQPTITYGGKSFKGENGVGIVKARVSGGDEMVISGKVAIKNKSGATKEEPWTHTIKIVKPQGTISLPEMLVLYRGYDNKVEGVASGYDKSTITGTGVTLNKTSGNLWTAKPNGGAKTATLTIIGQNSLTKKSVSLRTVEFKVRDLPKPSISVGQTPDGEKFPAGETRLFAGYGNDFPLIVKFSVVSWKISVAGVMKTAEGQGNMLNAEAIALLKQAKPGAMISFMTQVRYPGGEVKKRSASFTK
ncbi:MAG: hypothetical protein KA734_04095 [Fluviicola sp.]|nr:hypothetical protein [Fluviicola sp.]MBP6272324.1 hypothetical protein [Fluviicola sp.]